MAKKPRIKSPKSAKKGDVFQIKTLVSHVMETGRRKGKDGKIIPRQIINKFECKYNGTSAFVMDMFPSLSANPLIAFYLKATESGELEFIWTEDGGKVTSVKKPIKVT